MKNKFLNTWLQRAVALVLVFAGSMSSMLADTKLYIEDFTINDGEEKKVAVCLDTDVDNICSVSMTVNLPAGLAFVKDGDKIKMSIEGTRAGASMSYESAWKNGKIMFNDLLRKSAITAGNGAIFYIYVKESGLTDAQNLTISNVTLSCQDKTKVTDFTLAPGVASKSGTISTNASLTFAETTVNMAPGSTEKISVNMDNTKTVQGFESTLVLPDGFTAEVSSSRGTFSYNPEKGKILCTSDVIGNTGELLAITLTAPSTFTGNAQVKLTGTKITVDNKTEKLADIVMTVVSTEEQAAKPTVAFGVESAIIGAGKSADIDVVMTNLSTKVEGFQAYLVLPEGWSVVFTPKRGDFNYNATNGKILNYMGVTGEEGAVFTLTLTAPETFEGEAAVKLTNIKTTVNNASVQIDDITLTVKAKDADAKTAADAIVAALKEKFEAAKADMLEADVTKIGDEIDALEADVEAKFNDVTLVVDDVQAAADAISAEIDAALAAKVEADAKAAADAKLAELKAAAEPLAVSDEAKAYEAENVQDAVAAAEKAIADANDAVAAVEAKIAEGNLSTDNKDALAEAVAAAEKAVADAKTAAEAAEKTYADQKAADDAAAAEAAAKEAALAAQAKVKTDAAAANQAVAPEVINDADVKAAAAVLEANLTALDNAIANAETFKDNKTIAAAQKAAEDAVAALTEKAVAAKEAYDKAQIEASAKAAADAKLAELKAAVDPLKVSDEAKAYDNDGVKAAVAAAENSIAAAKDAVAAVESKIAEGNLSTDNKDALASAVAAAEKAISDANTAIAAAEKAYADQKKADDDAAAAEAAAKAAADAKLAELKAAVDPLKVSDEAKAYDNDGVKAAVAAAENSIAAANAAVAAVESKIAEGNLSTDNKDALASAVAAAEKAISDANTAIAAAEKAYADQKKADDDAAAAEAAAKAAADAKLAELKAAVDPLKVSDEAKAYDNDGVKAAVAAAENSIAAANAAVAAVESKIAEGNLSTDNKDALASAVAAAEKAISDANTAIAAAEKAYADQKKADDDAAAAEAAAKEETLAAQTKVKEAAAAAKKAVAPEVAETEDVKVAAEALDAALAALDNAIANAETFKDNKTIAEAQKAVEDAIATLKEKAAAAKDAYDKAQAEKKAANEAAYNRLTIQINALQSKLDMAKMTIDASCPDVADNFDGQVETIQGEIDALKAQLEADYAAIVLNEGSKLNADAVAKIEEEISALTKDAGKAQSAFVANREAYNRLTNSLDDLKNEFNDAIAIIMDKEKYPDAEKNLADDIAALQKMIDDAAAEIQAGYEAGTLNADSSFDAAAIKNAIADLLEKAKLVGIVSIKFDDNAETYYDLNGRPLSVPRAGQTVIVKMKDGTSKKVLLR